MTPQAETTRTDDPLRRVHHLTTRAPVGAPAVAFCGYEGRVRPAEVALSDPGCPMCYAAYKERRR